MLTTSHHNPFLLPTPVIHSLYPVLIVDYIFTFFKSEVEEAGLDKAQWDRTAVLFGLTAILTYLNWRGASQWRGVVHWLLLWMRVPSIT